ncbi:glycosyltransferase [bacterium SCSIO 12696]|uniref:glycosyltransferase n=1 Tax=Porticoccus sp. W117 TaxID=3054777 RepID=UPI0022067906|nr:glycosyltransferase [Porticoccus sp. W117]MDM3872372.1 glycosyltransferase [Porticoccus sp. W117]UTW46018.1 glycosyltransferase [bacterium SCSIO 12696]
MKILQLAKFYPPEFGGIEQVTSDLAVGITRCGHSGDVLCFTKKPESRKEELPEGLVFRQFSRIVLSSTPLSFSYIRKWALLRKSYELIHLHAPNPIASLAVFLFPLVRKQKLVVHWHSDVVKQRLLLNLFKPLQNFMLRRADVIIVTSEVYMEGSQDLQPFQEKCQVVPIGIEDRIDDVEFTAARLLPKNARNKKIVLGVGRLVYYKGFEYLIRSASGYPEDTIAVIAGVGEKEAELKNLVVDLGLSDKVFILGRVEYSDLLSLYRHSYIFCMSSVERSEAFGIVQLESMMFGKPVISTEIPGSGVPWVNQHGNSGIVVPPKSAEAICAAVIRLHDNENLYSAMSNGARKRFEEFFLVEKMVKEIVQIYQGLMIPGKAASKT